MQIPENEREIWYNFDYTVTVCASGSVVEHHLAKVGAAGSNPVSRSLGGEKVLILSGLFLFAGYSFEYPRIPLEGFRYQNISFFF